MSFIIATINLLALGLTSIQTYFGIIPALVILILWRRFNYTPHLGVITAEIQQYASSEDRIRTLKKVTLKEQNENRLFFKDVIFKKNLWNKIRGGFSGTNSLTGLKGHFCAIIQKERLYIFAFKGINVDTTIAFADDMNKSHSSVRIFCNITIRLLFIFSFPYLFYDVAYLSRRSISISDAASTLAPYAFFFLILAGYSLYQYIKNYMPLMKQWEIEQKDILKKTGIDIPLD